MKADPDFHPLAAAWLHSDASAPQTRLLNEILAHSGQEMDEFAALCHTEALLRLHGRSRADRLRALGTLVSSHPSARRITPVFRRRMLLAAAALLLLAFGVRAFITLHQSEGDAVTRRKPAIMLPPVNSSHRVTSPPSPLAHASRLEGNLRHLYIASFKAQSSLPEAVALLAQSVQSQNRSLALKPEFKSNGDAPVHLALEYPFSAWALLQMMAIQTGTRVQLSGESLVFQAAENAAPLEGVKSSGGSTVNLRRLVQPAGDHRRMGEYEMLEGLVAKQFGSPLNITRVMKYAMQFEGAPRLVQILDYAIKLVANPPIEVELTFHAMRAAPGLDTEIQLPKSGRSSLVAGVYTPQQFDVLLNGLSAKGAAGVHPLPALKAVPCMPVSSNLFASGFDAGWPKIKGTFQCFPSAPTLDLNCRLEYTNPDSPDGSHFPMETQQVLVWDGQTVSLGGIEGPDGSQITVFVTAKILENEKPEPASTGK